MNINVVVIMLRSATKYNQGTLSMIASMFYYAHRLAQLVQSCLQRHIEMPLKV